MKSCFVIGPIGPSDSKIRSHADDLIKYIIDPVVINLGYGRPDRADLLPEPGRITTQIVRQLKEADLVVADLTGGNPNVYYELCLRHAVARPVIHMALDDGSPIPFDVYDSRVIPFTLECRRADDAKERLTQQILHIEESGYKTSNLITEAIGTIALEASHQPTEQQLAKMARQLERISADLAAVPAVVRNEVASAVGRRSPYAFLAPSKPSARADVELFTTTPLGVPATIFDAATGKQDSGGG